MLTFLALLGVLGVLFAAAVLSTREGPVLADAPPDAADVPLPQEPLAPEDVGRLRFSLAARGYRMSEVDLALERLARELADRDRRIALLEAAAEGHELPAPVRQATGEDLPAAEPVAPPVAPPVVPVGAPLAPAPPPVPSPPAAVPTWLAPSSLFPPTGAEPVAEPGAEPGADPLPPADLGSELVAEERVEQAAPGAADDDRP